MRGARDAIEIFLEAWPDYTATGALDELRAREFGRLDAEGHTYLDYTGAGLYGASQVRRHSELLLVGRLRQSRTPRIPRRSGPPNWWRGPPSRPVVLQRVAGRLLRRLHRQREPGAEAGRRVVSVRARRPGSSSPSTTTTRSTASASSPGRAGRATDVRAGGPARPARRRADRRARTRRRPVRRARAVRVPGPVELLGRAARSRLDCRGAVAGVGRAARRRGLRAHQPARPRPLDARLRGAVLLQDVRLSRRAWARWWPAGPRSRSCSRPWFAGGTITVASVGADRHHLAPGRAGVRGRHARLHQPAGGGHRPASSSRRSAWTRSTPACTCLTGWLIDQPAGASAHDRPAAGHALRSGGRPGRGGTVTVNFRDASGGFIDHQRIEAAASERRISIRSGCFCNPGAGELAMGISPEEMTSCFAALRRPHHLRRLPPLHRRQEARAPCGSRSASRAPSPTPGRLSSSPASSWPES